MATKKTKRAFAFSVFGWLSLAGLSVSATTVRAETMAWAIPAGLYDTSNPGVTTNVAETFCVRNFSTDPKIDAAQLQLQFNTWLNDAKGWELIGKTKVDFVSSCSNPDPTINIDFYDIDDPAFTNTCSGGACAGYIDEFAASGKKVIDGENHNNVVGIKIGAQFWTCSDPRYLCDWNTDAKKKGVLQHEMGHLMGLGHLGPAMGITGDGGIYDGANASNPSPSEIRQARAHLDGKPSPALVPCMGFPDKNHVSVSWIDSANDETENRATFYRIKSGASSWTQVYDKWNGASSGVGSRVEFLSPPTTVLGYTWQAQIGVTGGPKKVGNWDFPTPLTAPSTTVPNMPCTLQVTSTSGGNIDYHFKDGSFNESNFEVWYSLLGDGGVLGTWNLRGYCSGAHCSDSTGGTSMFKAGDHLCLKVRATNSYGKSAYSNVACTYVKP